MSRCNDCDICMFEQPNPNVKYREKYSIFLCDKCFKKREDKRKKII